MLFCWCRSPSTRGSPVSSVLLLTVIAAILHPLLMSLPPTPPLDGPEEGDQVFYDEEEETTETLTPVSQTPAAPARPAEQQPEVITMPRAEWESTLFGCTSVKDTGLLCMTSSVACTPCVFSSALEAARLGSCAPDLRCTMWCCCATGLPCCTFAMARELAADKYYIAETPLESRLLGFFCPLCTHFQVNGHDGLQPFCAAP